jgi:hypothetical protein
MRSPLVLVVLVYLLGVGYELAPIFKAHWHNGTPADLSDAVMDGLPAAFVWPVTLYHQIMDAPSPPETVPTSK